MYRLFKAAEKCGCTPWELKKQPIYYQEYAIAFISLDNQVQNDIAKKGQRK